jgi:selenide, water dikinase
MGPEALAQVLRPLSMRTHPNLLVGLQTSDDAAVYKLSDEIAIIETVDFFAPVVDDPFTFGAISAANSVSDIFAMGGDVLFGLNIAAFPEDLPTEILSRIFEGGVSIMEQAGGVIAGGHTVTDDEPKYGIAVTGSINPNKILTKAGAKSGDVLYITKPIGAGVVTTALKNERVDPDDLTAAVTSMMTINREASLAVRSVDVTACTDVTGFGLLGHAYEISEKSGVGLRIAASAVPLLPGALKYVADGQIPGGLDRNRAYFSIHPAGGVAMSDKIAPDLATLLYNPETSGGLLIAVPEKFAARLEAAFASQQLNFWRIGEVVSGAGILVDP